MEKQNRCKTLLYCIFINYYCGINWPIWSCISFLFMYIYGISAWHKMRLYLKNKKKVFKTLIGLGFNSLPFLRSLFAISQWKCCLHPKGENMYSSTAFTILDNLGNRVFAKFVSLPVIVASSIVFIFLPSHSAIHLAVVVLGISTLLTEAMGLCQLQWPAIPGTATTICMALSCRVLTEVPGVGHPLIKYWWRIIRIGQQYKGLKYPFNV